MASDSYSSMMDTINQLIINPFIEDLIDHYGEKTLNNKNIVECLAKSYDADFYIRYVGETYTRGLQFDYINCIDNNIKKSNTDKVVIALEGLWKIIWQPGNLKTTYPAYPDERKMYNYIKEMFNNKIDEYYQDVSDIGITDTKEEIITTIKNICKMVATVHVTTGLSSRITFLNASIGNKIDKTKNFAYCNFDGIDFTDCCKISDYDTSYTSFVGCKFHGDGSTRTCFHTTAIGSNFTNVVFGGSICNKVSRFSVCNFTGADLTGLSNNRGNAMLKCDFTDAFVIKDGVKLMGKHLMKYLDKEKDIKIDFSYYHSPDDGGYVKDALDDSIWI